MPLPGQSGSGASRRDGLTGSSSKRSEGPYICPGMDAGRACRIPGWPSGWVASGGWCIYLECRLGSSLDPFRSIGLSPGAGGDVRCRLIVHIEMSWMGSQLGWRAGR